MELLTRSWNRSWQALQAAPAAGLFEQLIACWGAPPRRYHTLQHLGECIERLDPVLSRAEHPGEVEVALWFHDAVYAPQRQDNEAQSALWARRALEDAGLRGASLSRVESLIMATRHSVLPQTPDEDLLVDVDLSILGAAPARFAKYEAQVRAEYDWIPAAQFQSRRAAILEGFLGRAAIYRTEHFRRLCEAQARQNLENSLREMRRGA